MRCSAVASRVCSAPSPRHGERLQRDLGGVAEADVDGAAVTLDASGKAVIEADRLGDSDEPVTIALHVRAGTTVSHVTWNKQ